MIIDVYTPLAISFYETWLWGRYYKNVTGNTEADTNDDPVISTHLVADAMIEKLEKLNHK